jgi:multidrug efflux system outer membrane protein
MKQLLVLLLISFVGCSVGTKYIAPEVDLPCEWNPEHAEEFSEEPIDLYRWWESFNDPILNAIIEQAANQNLDLHLAMTRILEARLALKGGQANLLPHVDGSITYSYARYNQKLVDDILGFGHCRRGHRNLNLFEAGFDADWELDLFGLARYKNQSLEAMVEASYEDFSNAWVTLSAEIARSYIELRGFQQRLIILEDNIQSQMDAKEMTKSLIVGGFTGSLEQIQVDDELNMLIAQKPQFEYLIYRNIHHLSILLGYLPRDLVCQLMAVQPLPNLPCRRPIGIPSELLRRRPDIRKAERQVASASAEVGAAIAAQFPRVSLTGFIGEIATACTKGSFVGFGGPQVLLPIFNSRLLQDDVCLNKIKVEQALIQYQKKVLEALEETENAIAAFHYGMKKVQYLEDRKNSSHDAYFMVLQLYESGLKNYLEVQTNQRTFLAADEEFLQGKVDLLLNYISLYKALGGGWDVFECP